MFFLVLLWKKYSEGETRNSHCIALSSRLAYEIISDFYRTGLIYQEKYNSCKGVYEDLFLKKNAKK